jgi:hypothetical protein
VWVLDSDFRWIIYLMNAHDSWQVLESCGLCDRWRFDVLHYSVVDLKHSTCRKYYQDDVPPSFCEALCTQFTGIVPDCLTKYANYNLFILFPFGGCRNWLHRFLLKQSRACTDSHNVMIPSIYFQASRNKLNNCTFRMPLTPSFELLQGTQTTPSSQSLPWISW